MSPPFTDSTFDEDRYSLFGHMEILSLLQSLLHDHQTISVQYGGGSESLLTTLLSVRSEGIVFDFSIDPASSERLLTSKRLYFSCRPDGVQVRFQCDAPQRIPWDGGTACWVALPRRITRLQRREYFRVIAPVAKPITVRIAIPELGDMDLVIHDLAVGGAGLTLADDGHALSVGGVLPAVQVRLGRSDVVKIDLSIKHLTKIDRASSKPVTRLGVAFLHMARQHEAALQRWVIQLDQERRKFEHQQL